MAGKKMWDLGSVVLGSRDPTLGDATGTPLLLPSRTLTGVLSMASLTFGGLGLGNWSFPSHKASLSPPYKVSSGGLEAGCLGSASFSLGSVFSFPSEDQELSVQRVTASTKFASSQNAVPSWGVSHIK